MKHEHNNRKKADSYPAAFRRLCVETIKTPAGVPTHDQPPSGGCVLKPSAAGGWDIPAGPAAFRRLCVETAATLPKPN